MKVVVALASLLFVISAASLPFNLELDVDWNNFKKKYNKNYNEKEEAASHLIWEQNVAVIISHNLEYDLGLRSYRIGLNKYADMEHKEFVRRMNGYRRGNSTAKSTIRFISPPNSQLPSYVDWRDKGLVTPVKDQQQCGSCWAFSALGTLEGRHKMKRGNLVSLSEQNLVDCSDPQGNMGCEGGLMGQAFEYIMKNKGIDTEESYPYEAEDGDCRFKTESIGATIVGYVNLFGGDENDLQYVVAKGGPIAVAIDASSIHFQLYSSGIYDEPDCSSTELDHGVLVVGYGTDDGQDYWLVKNSWGDSWGLQGYIKMSRNKNNQCGIATRATYPLL